MKHCFRGLSRFLGLVMTFLLPFQELVGQDHVYNKVWIFGGEGGVDFSSGKPAAIPAKMSTIEGVASATGPNGKLLFYTDGSTVWNARHEVMANGGSLQPYSTYSSTQAAVIVPMPDSAKYYIFSLTEGGRFGGSPEGSQLYYSVVNMDACLGEVEPGRKGVLLEKEILSEKMTAVRGDNCNVWVIVHGRDGNMFRSFEITSSGVNPAPVISYSGPSATGNNCYQGVMKISPDRRSLALAISGNGEGVELHKFDPASGKVSGGFFLDKRAAYGVAFSPNSSKMYATLTLDPNSAASLVQFDISSARPEVFSVIAPSIFQGDIQLGPDNRVYSSSGGSPHGWSWINLPDKKGAECLFEISDFKHYGEGPVYGLPNAVPVLQAKDTVYSSVVVKLAGCSLNEPLTLSIATGRDHLWDDSTICKTRIVYKPGSYFVKYLGASCIYHVDTFIVPSLPAFSQSEKCTGPGAAWLDADVGDTTTWRYKWYDSGNRLLRSYATSHGDTLTNIAGGNYSIHLDNGGGCDTSILFNVALRPIIAALPESDTVFCSGAEITFQAQYTEKVSNYFWDLGNGNVSNSQSPSKIYTIPGDYTIKHSVVSKDGCLSDTLFKKISVYKMPEIEAGEGVTIIAGDAVSLKAVVNDTVFKFLWSPPGYLSNAHVLTPVAKPPATQWYYLSASGGGGCVASDSVKITVLEKITIPNAFSPNGDGINDVWNIPGLVSYQNCKTQVFNRWGQMVFESKGYNKPWDGKLRGSPLPVGVYYFILRFDDGKQLKSGSVTILK